MNYPYENLDPESFQEFVQALIAREYPDIQCLPVGQPDGGRDALTYLPTQRLSGSKQFVIYQVKFARDPVRVSDPVDWLKSTLNREAAKVAKHLKRGVLRYVLVTNLKGSAHSESGTVDRIQETLSELLPVPAICWWRDDINRRLDSAWDLKWTYPQLMTGPDLIRLLVEKGLGDESPRRRAAVRAFLQEQYNKDREIRFKQVELQNSLFDLFIDVPVEVLDPSAETSFGEYHLGHLATIIGRDFLRGRNRGAGLGPKGPRSDFLKDPHMLGQRLPIGAATTILHKLTQSLVPKLVLEGAPGQGKSTIVQYVCQIHRIRLLQMSSHSQRGIPEAHLNSPLRLPFKVDLRDLSDWVVGVDPFSDKDTIPNNHHDRPKTLEAFLAAQVRLYSGGADFSVDDLIAVMGLTPVIIVLDGLDEVADIKRREGVVREIQRGVSRLDANALSLQVIVTSRPAAFANSPGLPPDEFPYFQLGVIETDLAIEYAEKWLRAKRVDRREHGGFKRILAEKLAQPHLRDLAKNPMQLAILLSLLHTRGSSLPDKRTSLYVNYVDLFFDREAEKSPVVRMHRDLLVNLHGFLGWTLHSEAESGQHRGRVSEERLLSLVDEYLAREGYRPGLRAELFKGMVERIVAIVSRIEGTFEFDVQPLREYFAGRYLYETAPYSPVGSEKSGTKLERFDALARNFYWLNVTRFYAGCYSVGELASLIDGVKVLLEDQDHRDSGHPRLLALSLLKDYVFSQNPRSVRSLLDLIMDGKGLRLLLARNRESVLDHTKGSLVLPLQCGREVLVEQCMNILDTLPPEEYLHEALSVIRNNTDRRERFERWWSSVVRQSASDRVRWFKFGQHLGVLDLVQLSDLCEFVGTLQGDAKSEVEDTLFAAGRSDYFQDSQEKFDRAVASLLDGKVGLAVPRLAPSLLEVFSYIIRPLAFGAAIQFDHPVELREVWRRYGYSAGIDTDLEGLVPPKKVDSSDCKEWLGLVGSLSRLTANEWATSLTPWDNVVETGRKQWGDRWSWCLLANFAAAIRSQSETCVDAKDLFATRLSLCRRVRYARLRAGNPKWWGAQLDEVASTYDATLALLVLGTWGTARTIVANIARIDRLFESMRPELFERLVREVSIAYALRLNRTSYRKRAKSFAIDMGDDLSSVSARTLSFLAPRRGFGWRTVSRRMVDESGERVVLEAAAHLILVNERGRWQDWHSEVDVLGQIYVKGVLLNAVGPKYRARRSSVSVPREIAERVLRSPEGYPSLVIRAAEDSFREKAAGVVRPVGVVAKEQHWF